MKTSLSASTIERNKNYSLKLLKHFNLDKAYHQSALLKKVNTKNENLLLHDSKFLLSINNLRVREQKQRSFEHFHKAYKLKQERHNFKKNSIYL